MKDYQGCYDITDVMEAVEFRFKNDENAIAGIYAFLFSNLPDVKGSTLPLTRWLDEHNRCYYCGNRLDVAYDREYHPEVDAFEHLSIPFCPNCDFPDTKE